MTCRLCMALILLMVLGIHPIQSVSIMEASGKAPWPTDSWSRSTPEQQGMNSTVLNAMIDYYVTNGVQVDSVLVIKNGYLVMEEYLSRYGPDDMHHLFSCTKSITSTLVGIGVRMGYIESLDQHVFQYFSNRTWANAEARKESITLRNLLTMSSGLEWDEDYYGETINDYNRMVRSKDWIQYVLDKPMAANPGSIFSYNSGSSHLLSAILHQVTDTDPRQLVEEWLFKPLGIKDFEWDADPQGLSSGASGMKLRPQDMAKVGYLYLRNGLWNDSEILAPDWVALTSECQMRVDQDIGYSFQWWTIPELHAYYALGWGQQSIIVVPERDILVVVTAKSIHPSTQVPWILREWVLPAIGVPTETRLFTAPNPLALLTAAAPFVVIIVAYVADRRGLWNDE